MLRSTKRVRHLTVHRIRLYEFLVAFFFFSFYTLERIRLSLFFSLLSGNGLRVVEIRKRLGKFDIARPFGSFFFNCLFFKDSILC